MAKAKRVDVMIDYETMSGASNAATPSLGAVVFDIEKGTVDKDKSFYRNIDLQSCMDAGLQVDGNTIMWWLEQSDAARKHLTTPEPVSLDTAMNAFRDYLLRLKYEGEDIHLWSNGSNFDTVILDNTFKAIGLHKPWKFRSIRDTRTVVDMYGQERFKELKAALIKNMELDPEFVLHNALSDAILQATYTGIMWKSIQTCLMPPINSVG